MRGSFACLAAHPRRPPLRSVAFGMDSKPGLWLCLLPPVAVSVCYQLSGHSADLGHWESLGVTDAFCIYMPHHVFSPYGLLTSSPAFKILPLCANAVRSVRRFFSVRRFLIWFLNHCNSHFVAASPLSNSASACCFRFYIPWIAAFVGDHYLILVDVELCGEQRKFV